MRIKHFLVSALFIFGMIVPLVFAKETAVKSSEVSKEKSVEPAKERKIIRAKGMASGITDVVKSPKALVSETVEGTKSNPPVLGTVKGLTEGAGEVAKQSVSGAAKVVTLGHVKELEMVEPEKPADVFKSPTEGKPTKFKIKFW